MFYEFPRLLSRYIGTNSTRKPRDTVYKSSRSVILGFRCGVDDIYAILGFYAEWVSSYPHFGTSYRSHLLRSNSSRRLKLFDS